MEERVRVGDGGERVDRERVRERERERDNRQWEREWEGERWGNETITLKKTIEL